MAGNITTQPKQGSLATPIEQSVYFLMSMHLTLQQIHLSLIFLLICLLGQQFCSVFALSMKWCKTFSSQCFEFLPRAFRNRISRRTWSSTRTSGRTERLRRPWGWRRSDTFIGLGLVLRIWIRRQRLGARNTGDRIWPRLCLSTILDIFVLTGFIPFRMLRRPFEWMSAAKIDTASVGWKKIGLVTIGWNQCYDNKLSC